MQKDIQAYKFKLELHAHTSPVSACSRLSPSEVIARLHEQGYHGVVIANHFLRGGKFMQADDPVAAYLEDYCIAKEAGEALGMKVYLGAEYRFDENVNDYLVYGASEALLRETVGRFDMTFNRFYEEYHNEHLLILQAHPFRKGMVPADPAHLDGIEAFNMHPGHNSRMADSVRFARENGLDIMTAGTDLHYAGDEGLCATRTKTLPSNEAELVALLRSREYLVEMSGCPILPYASFCQ